MRPVEDGCGGAVRRQDPITPLSSAYEVSAGFKNSRVVVHEGHGVSFLLMVQWNAANMPTAWCDESPFGMHDQSDPGVFRQRHIAQAWD